MSSDTEHAVSALSVPGKEFEFTLKLRVESPTALWRAAARHCTRGTANSADELAELIGPLEDPSIEDCLMALALPSNIPGCTMLNVFLGSDGPERQGSAGLGKP